MLAIVKTSKDIDGLGELIEQYLGYIPMIYSFNELFIQYKNKIKKTKRNFATEEFFSLSYDSLLRDLKESLFVQTNKEELPILQKYFKVIEVCE